LGADRRCGGPAPGRWLRGPEFPGPVDDSFSGWTKTFTDPRLCAAIADRLTLAGNIIETGTSSYRLAHARAQRTRNA